MQTVPPPKKWLYTLCWCWKVVCDMLDLPPTQDASHRRDDIELPY